jgi:ribonuclease HI
MPKPKFYVVWKGRRSGIFSSWEECSAQVAGFAGAEYKSFANRAAAEIAFLSTYESYKGKKISDLGADMLWKIGQPISESYCVDASCSGNPGWMEYRCVHTTSKEELFHEGPYENGTNNIGEFLAIVHALALFKKCGWTYPIYSDSETAILWVITKKCKTRLVQDDKNVPIFDMIAEAEEWLENNEVDNQVLKWKTEAWGEIPADYGRK